MAETLCRACHHHPVADAFCCASCADAAAADLRRVAAVVDDLAPGRRGGPAAMGSAYGSRAPVPAHVIDVRNEVRVSLHGTARVLLEHGASADGLDPHEIAPLATWLVQHVDRLSKMDEGPDEYAAIARCRRRLDRLVVAPPRAVWLGQCGAQGEGGPCEVQLFAAADDAGRPTEGVVTCSRCGAQVDVEDRRALALALVEDHELTMRDLAHRMAGMVSRRTLERAVARGALVARGEVLEPNDRGEVRAAAVYRLGDALGLIERGRGAA